MLVLNTRGSYSCIAEMPHAIPATPLNMKWGSHRISKIIVGVEDPKSWFIAEGNGKYADSYSNLYSVLAKLMEKTLHQFWSLPWRLHAETMQSIGHGGGFQILCLGSR